MSLHSERPSIASGSKIRRSEQNYYQVFEFDKKMKREIANSNERRRMQSINTGFDTLKELLPMSSDGEKLSKASILQLTAQYIQTLLSKLSALETEISNLKKTSLNNEKSQPIIPTISQEHTRKRRLNSCTSLDVNNPITVYIDSEPTDNNRTFSLPGSELCLLTCEGSEKTLGSLEHLVAAIEQVEGERFHVSGSSETCMLPTNRNHDPFIGCSLVEWKTKDMMSQEESPAIQSNPLLNKAQPTSNHSSMTPKFESVMKPTISPYTEKIILAVSQHPDIFDNPQYLPSHIFMTTSSQSTFYDENFHSFSPPNNSKTHKCQLPEAVFHENKTL